ncbi:hypothetical protein EL22_05980 [Halostagnicola sp. A56]|uniref:hypothetical protein n=1 Tax=Halostagnicola sp. A56 TaxID=1495067 RepID=UPI00065F6A27|nr:hypothetical protein [Halostagnicola sp. A56]KDE58270.2 hypothetical protein EL22_05980 [Halostagnicola sp. A56]
MAVDDSNPVQWRQDAATSPTVRILWSLGAGTFFAAVLIIVFWRLYDMARQFGAELVIIVAFAAVVLGILVVAFGSNTERRLERLTDRLPITAPTGTSLDRALDATLGMLVMTGTIVLLMAVGRYVSTNELLALGAGPFTLLAALTIPLALVALALSSFLRSVGTLDYDDRAIYLHDPDRVIDLDVIEDVSIYRVRNVAILNLTYAQPDGQYVKGPRTIVVPPGIATDVKGLLAESN